MFRLLTLLVCLPSLASADWSPRPSMFTYEATFAGCTADPTAPDLWANCAAAMEGAFALKRAVAWGAYKCHPEDLATCAAPFEDEGLPAVAVQIAVDTGCDSTDLAALARDTPLSRDHCVTIASEIMIDEGVVPVFSDVICSAGDDTCTTLSAIHLDLWSDAIAALSSSDLTEIRKTDAANTCRDRYLDAWGPLDCAASRFAEIWADLAQQEQEN